jgi:hypothetical protein
VKALEKALQQLKSQEGNQQAAPKAQAAADSGDKSAEYLIKQSRRFGDSLIAFYEEERNRAQGFLDTINAIESGSYAPKSAGRRKNPSHKEAMEAGDINDNK